MPHAIRAHVHGGIATRKDRGRDMAAEVDFGGFSEGSLESLGGDMWRTRFSRATEHGRE
jgi:hypothetical protein